MRVVGGGWYQDVLWQLTTATGGMVVTNANKQRNLLSIIPRLNPAEQPIAAIWSSQRDEINLNSN